MTDLEAAIDAIDNQLDSILNPLVLDETVTKIAYGTKWRRGEKPDPPFLQIVYDEAVIDETGSTGRREYWKQPIKIGSTVKNTDDPKEGFREARRIVSKARNLLLADRQFGIPEIVRTVESTKIVTVPFPFGDKTSLYGAGTVLNVFFMIDNK